MKSLENLWKYDPVLQKIYLHISEKRYKYISFDCFDTIIKRFSPSPVYLFKEVGRRLAKENILPDEREANSFLFLRAYAERKSNEEYGLPNLSEIYDNLKKVVSDHNLAAQIEFETEKDLCFLNLYISGFMKFIYENLNCKIIVISDTYLQKNHISELLENIGFDNSYVENIFTSCDERASKANDGKLFEAVLKKLEISSEEILHIGDDEKSDYINAFLKGIKSFHYLSVNNVMQKRVFHREKLLLGKTLISNGFDSIRNLVSNADYHIPQEMKKYYESGSFIFGPLFTRFSDWCLGHLKEKKINQAFALMREGEVLGELLKNTALAVNYDLQVDKIHVSRQSTSIASIISDDYDKLIAIFSIYSDINLNKIFKIYDLHILKEKYQSIYPEDDLNTPFSKYSVKKLVDNILKENDLVDILLRIAAKKRTKLLKYLEPFIKEERIAIVDIGYGATIQENLADIFEYEGRNVEFTGLYFGTSIRAVEKALKGHKIHSYLGNFNQHLISTNSFLTNPVLFEEVLHSGTGSTFDYSINEKHGTSEPVPDENYYSETEIKQRKYLQSGILDFQAYWLKILTYKLNTVSSDVMENICYELDQHSHVILNRFMSFPHADEVKTLGQFTDSDFRLRAGNSNRSSFSICDASYSEIFAKYNLEGLFNSDCQWPQGVASISMPVIIDQFFYIWETFSNLNKKYIPY